MRGRPGRRALLLLGAVAGGFLLRLGLMSTRGDFLEFDESFYLLIARSLREGRGLAFNGLPEIAFPPLPALLLAGLDAVFGSMIVPSRIAAALLGALTAIPIHRVARRWLGRREAAIAALFVAVCPTLTGFAPIELPAPRRLDFGHESLYLLLAASALWAFAGVVRRPRATGGLALGIAGGLAYLTRNEAILLAGGLVALLALRALGARRPARAAPGAAAATLASALALAALAAPLPIYLHRVTGAWTLSGKSGTAALIRPTVVSWVRDGDFYAYEKALYALDPSGDRMRSSYWGWDGQRQEGSLGLSAAAVLDNADVYVRIALPALFPWPLWPLLAAGFVRLATRRGRGAGPVTPWIAAGILLSLAPSLVVVAVLFVEPRHHLYLVPLGLAVAAAGVVEIARRARRPRLVAPLAGAAAAVLLALSLLPLWTLRHADTVRPEATKFRRIGEVLDRLVPPGGTVASYHPAIGVWSNRDWRVLPAAAFPQMAAYAIRRGMATIVLERGVFRRFPGEDGEGRPTFAIYRFGPLEAAEAGRAIFRIEEEASTDLYRLFKVAGL